MGVDIYGHHREGREGAHETEIRTECVCDRCLLKTTCAMWENRTIDHTDGPVSSFSYICITCIRESALSLERYLKAHPGAR